MPKFKKMILPVGEYSVTRPDGTRVIKNFPKDYLKEVVTNFGKMKELGLRVPAPFKHLKEAVPVTEAMDGNSYDNAGYWDSMELGTDEKSGDFGLIGVIEAPGSEDDMETPAGKLKHRIKEVSACIKDSWTDGLNRQWGPSILHAAPVTNPIVPGQSEFSLIEDSYALSITGMVQESDIGDLSELATSLREAVGVFIPDGITQKDLVKVLLVSLRQLKLTKEQANDEGNEVVNVSPVFMSHSEGTKMALSKQAADEMIALGAINPKTQKPFVITDFEIKADESKIDQEAFLSMQTFAKAATTQLQAERRSNLQRRIAGLVASGRVTKDYADANLSNQLETYELSIGANAEFVKSPLETLIDAFEKLEAKTPAATEVLLSDGLPNGYDTHSIPDGSEVELSAEKSQELLKDMLSRV